MRILVVDDDEHLRKSLVEFLREEGFATDSAADGEEGLYKLRNWEYDALVLDVMMPRMDGYEVLRRLRAGGSGIPVLFLTARDGLADRVRGLNGGADDYLVKPFELEEFLARIRAALRRTGGQPAPVLRSGSVELNTGSRTVFLKGKPVELTAREYALLEILLRQSGGFVTRDYLYEHLFDERDDSLSNMLDVYVYRLRQKFGSQRIVTRRGAGYQWVPE